MIKNRYFTLFITLVIAAAIFVTSCKKEDETVVKIGLLHSLSGTMEISERSVLDAELLAIKEINAAGGVLGHQIEAIQENGNSDAQTFADKARKLITEDKVVSIFGCWTSDSRKAVKNVVEEYYNLLWYPVQYEGMEASPNIMYVGACPNQQVVPAIDYCAQHMGKRMYLIGNDYVFPQIANKIIKAQLKDLGGECVCERYVPMDETDFQEIIADIQSKRPDVIVNTLNGSSNVAFFSQFKMAGLSPENYPVISFSVSENEIGQIGATNIRDHYVAWTYFESTKTNKNNKFVNDYKTEYGFSKSIGDPVEAGYLAIYLWAAACEKAGTFDIESVRIASKNLRFIGPEGLVTIDGSNQHLYKVARIGIITGDGSIEEVWSTNDPVRPDPYLSTYHWARGL